MPLGFLLGWLLLALAARGEWEAALMLPLYYLADATLTLLRRLARGEKVWRAHREHYYQQAVQNGRSHARVSAAVGTTNLALIALSLAAAATPDGIFLTPLLLGAAAVIVVGLLSWMHWKTGAPFAIALVPGYLDGSGLFAVQLSGISGR